MITRRGLLTAILAGAAAPAIVRASSLMPIAVPKVWVPGDFAFSEALAVLTSDLITLASGECFVAVGAGLLMPGRLLSSYVFGPEPLLVAAGDTLTLSGHLQLA